MTTSPIFIFHIGAGAIGLLSGAASMFFRKGSRPHRTAGNIFFISMLGMSASAAYLAFLQPVMLSVLNGILAFYLVATAWMTVKRKAGEVGAFEIGGLLAVLAIAAGFLSFGVEAANSETRLKDGFSAAHYYFFGVVAVLCAALDMRLILRGGVSGAQRIARHLWRMCFAMWMATTAFFLGQEKLFPELVRETQIFYAPVILVAVLMMFWLRRVLFTNRYKTR
jgi:hypothetical protein